MYHGHKVCMADIPLLAEVVYSPVDTKNHSLYDIFYRLGYILTPGMPTHDRIYHINHGSRVYSKYGLGCWKFAASINLSLRSGFISTASFLNLSQRWFVCYIHVYIYIGYTMKRRGIRDLDHRRN